MWEEAINFCVCCEKSTILGGVDGGLWGHPKIILKGVNRMSANKTPNYALHSWEPEDEFHLSEINENFSALDSAVKSEADTARAAREGLTAQLATKAGKEELTALKGVVDTKATATAVSGLSEQVNAELSTLKNTVAGKADTSALNSLASTVGTKADTAALNNLASTVGTKADTSALNSLSSTVSALQTTVSGKADLSALNSVQAGVTRFLFGKYAGTGNNVSQTITLSVNPQVVLVMNARGARYSTNYISAYSGMAFLGYDSEGGALKVHEGGFTVDEGGGTYLNETNNNYFYLVWY